MATLGSEEVEKCRQAFEKFDADGSGSIDVEELTTLLTAVGFHATEEEVIDMMRDVDGNGSGELDFAAFLQIVEKQILSSKKQLTEQDTLDAFVAMGGNADKTGTVRADKLVQVIREFELTIDIEQLIAEADQDHSGFIDYEEFDHMIND